MSKDPLTPPAEPAMDLQYLHDLLADATRKGALPVESLYPLSVAICELQDSMNDPSERKRLRAEYGNRLMAQLVDMRPVATPIVPPVSTHNA